jgi:hypothetical protein
MGDGRQHQEPGLRTVDACVQPVGAFHGDLLLSPLSRNGRCWSSRPARIPSSGYR